MAQLSESAPPEFELTVEEGRDFQAIPGFYVTRTRTFFVNNFGQTFLLAAPGQRAMLQRVDDLPADAEPTRAITDPDLWMLARATQVLGKGAGATMTLADFYAARGRLFHVRQCRVFELRREPDGPRFVEAANLPASAVPFTESEAEQLPSEIAAAARVLDASATRD